MDMLAGDVVDISTARQKRERKRFLDLVDKERSKREDIEATLAQLLTKLGFRPAYAAIAASDLAEGFLKQDEVPLWHSPLWRSGE